jgi:enterochelin esterase-like enzyme
MKFFAILALCFSSGCVSTSLRKAIEDSKTTCREFTVPVPWKYCLTPGDPESVIYYFHGGGGSELDWIDPSSYSGELIRLWKQNNDKMPTVISISFGEMWILAKKNSRPKSGLYEIFQNDVMSYVEQKVLSKIPRERILLGESMGGMNAGIYGLNNPQQFSKIALICPGLNIGDDVAIDSPEEYARKTGADQDKAQIVIKMKTTYFPSGEEALAQSPRELLKRLHSDKKTNPQIFISCGNRDEFGFFKSAEDFAELATKKGLATIWRPVTGRHCSMDIESLSKFLSAAGRERQRTNQ